MTYKTAILVFAVATAVALVAGMIYADPVPMTNVFIQADRGVVPGTTNDATNVVGCLRHSGAQLQIYNGASWQTIGNTNSSSPDHSTLNELDYASAGHTGFMASDGSTPITGSTTVYGNLTVASNLLVGSKYQAATNNITIALTPALSAAQIQTLFNNLPRNMNGYSLAVSFGAGTYNLSGAVDLYGIYNAHAISVGAASVGGASTQQVATLVNTNEDATYHHCNLLYLDDLHARGGIVVDSLAFSNRTVGLPADGVSGTVALTLWDCGGQPQVSSCYFLGDTTNGGTAIKVFGSRALVYQNYFGNQSEAVTVVDGGHVGVESNLSVVAKPYYGQSVSRSGIVSLYDSDENDVGVTNKISSGGIFVDSAGKRL